MKWRIRLRSGTSSADPKGKSKRDYVVDVNLFRLVLIFFCAPKVISTNRVESEEEISTLAKLLEKSNFTSEDHNYEKVMDMVIYGTLSNFASAGINFKIIIICMVDKRAVNTQVLGYGGVLLLGRN